MQKVKIICLIVSIVMATTGTILAVTNLDGGGVTPPIDTSKHVYTYMDKPTEGTPLDNDAINNLFIAQGELKRAGSFKGVTSGETVSVGISQAVSNMRVVLNGNAFKEMITSGIKKNAYQLYLYGDQLLHREADKVRGLGDVDWANTAARYDEETFYQKFGHRSNELTGYILNTETVLKGELVKQESGMFTYRYELDVEKAPAALKYEMVTNGGLNGLPTFSKAVIVVTMDSNWVIHSLSTDCEYKVSMAGMNVTCTEDITEVITDHGKIAELPETDFYKQFFGAEVNQGGDKAPDALTMLLDMLAPHMGEGKSLDVALNVAMDSEQLASALVSAQIDITNLENIAADVKVGEDLYLTYEGGKLFVTYQDFKGSTTVDGIMGLVGAFMGEGGGGLFDNVDTDSLLEGANCVIGENSCIVNLPIALGDISLNAQFWGKKQGENYVFSGAQATIGNVVVDVTPVEKWSAPARTGEYPEILGLVDIIKDGVLGLAVNVGDIVADVTLDINTMSLVANAQIPQVGNVQLLLLQDVVYLTYGEVKLKITLEEATTIINGLSTLLGDSGVAMPQLSVGSILQLLQGITATATENGTAFQLNVEGVDASINLANNGNNWNLQDIVVAIGETSIVVSPAEPQTIPQVDGSQYSSVVDVVKTFIKPIKAIIEGDSYGANFNLAVELDGNTYALVGDVAYDKVGNLSVDACLTDGIVALLDAKVIVANNVLYLNVNGIKTAVDLSTLGASATSADGGVDLTAIVGLLYGKNDVLDSVIDSLADVIEKVSNLKLEDIQIDQLISDFGYNNGTLSIVADLGFVGLGNVALDLSAKEESIAAQISAIKLGDVTASIGASLVAGVDNVVVPNADDYLLNFVVDVAGVQAYLSANLLAMDVNAQIAYNNQLLQLRFVGNNVYVKFGNLALVADVTQIPDLVGRFVGDSQGSADLGALLGAVASLAGNLNVDALLAGISADLHGEQPYLSLALDGGSVSINFNNVNGALVFDNITANIGEIDLTFAQTDYQIEKLDVTANYVDAVALAQQVANVIDHFDGAQGVCGTAQIALDVDGTNYTLDLDLNYNGGVQATLVLKDEIGALVNATVHFVDGVLYLNVNGITQAINLATLPIAASNNTTIETVLGVLSQLKGYNGVLDSVLQVAETVVTKALAINLAEVDFSSVIQSCSFNNGVLAINLDGAIVGLGEFGLAIDTNNGLGVEITNLAIGSRVVVGVAANATASETAVVAPNASDYTNDFALTVGNIATANLHVDLFNMNVYGNAIIYNNNVDLLFDGNALFIQSGNVKLKLAVNDIGDIVGAITNLVASLAPGGTASGGSFGALDAKAIVNSIVFAHDSNGFSLGLNVAGIGISVAFASNATLANVGVEVSGMQIDLAPTSNNVTNNVDPVGALDVKQLADAYLPVVDALLSAKGYALTLNGLELTIGTETYTLNGTVLLQIEGGLKLQADVTLTNSTNTLLVARVHYLNNKLFVDVNGLKQAINLKDFAQQGSGNNSAEPASSVSETLQQIANVLQGNVLADVILDVKAIVDAAMSLDLTTLNFAEILTELTFADATLQIVANGNVVTLGDSVTVALTALANGAAIELGGLFTENLAIGGSVVATAFNGAIVEPDARQYTANIAVTLGDLALNAHVDLFNMRVAGYATYGPNRINILFENSTLYATFGNLRLKVALTANSIDQIIAEISTLVEAITGKPLTMPNMDLDVAAILNSLALVTEENGGYTLSLAIATIGIAATFDAQATLTSANVIIDGDMPMDVGLTLADTTDVADMDVTATFVDLHELLTNLAPAISTLVTAKGYSIAIDDIQIRMDGHWYTIALNMLLDLTNKAASVTLTVFDGAKSMVELSAQVVNNVAYVNVNNNMLRLSLDSLSFLDFQGKSLADILSALEDFLLKLQGVNGTLDDIIDTVTGLLNKTAASTEIGDFSGLIESLTFANGELALVINGADMDVDDFQITLTNSSTSGVANISLSGLVATDNSFEISFGAGVLTVDNATVTEPTNANEYIDLGFVGKLVPDLYGAAISDITGKLSTTYTFSGNISASLPVVGDALNIDVLSLTAGITAEGNIYVTMLGDLNEKKVLGMTLTQDWLMGFNLAYDDVYGDYLVTVGRKLGTADAEYKVMTLQYLTDNLLKDESCIAWMLGTGSTLWGMVAGGLDLGNIAIDSGVATPDTVTLTKTGVNVNTVTGGESNAQFSINKLLVGVNAVIGGQAVTTFGNNSTVSELGLTDNYYAFDFNNGKKEDGDPNSLGSLTNDGITSLYAAILHSPDPTKGLQGLIAKGNIGGAMDFSLNLTYNDDLTRTYDVTSTQGMEEYSVAADVTADTFVADTYYVQTANGYQLAKEFSADATYYTKYFSTDITKYHAPNLYKVVQNKYGLPIDFAATSETAISSNTFGCFYLKADNSVEYQNQEALKKFTLRVEYPDGTYVEQSVKYRSAINTPSAENDLGNNFRYIYFIVDEYGDKHLLPGGYTHNTVGNLTIVAEKYEFKDTYYVDGVVYKYDETVGNSYYVDGTYTVAQGPSLGVTDGSGIDKYSSANERLVLQHTLGTFYPVTSIRGSTEKGANNGAFVGTNVVNVVVPASITTVGGRAFYNVDSLQNVVFLADTIKCLSDGTTPNAMSASNIGWPFYDCNSTLNIYYTNVDNNDEIKKYFGYHESWGNWDTVSYQANGWYYLDGENTVFTGDDGRFVKKAVSLGSQLIITNDSAATVCSNYKSQVATQLQNALNSYTDQNFGYINKYELNVSLSAQGKLITANVEVVTNTAFYLVDIVCNEMNGATVVTDNVNDVVERNGKYYVKQGAQYQIVASAGYTVSGVVNGDTTVAPTEEGKYLFTMGSAAQYFTVQVSAPKTYINVYTAIDSVFDGNTKLAAGTHTVETTAGGKLKNMTTSQANYTFMGWARDDGNGVKFVGADYVLPDGYVSNGNVDFYAIWVHSNQASTYSASAGGNTVAVTSTSGTGTFYAWYYNSNFATQGATISASNTVLYARWQYKMVVKIVNSGARYVFNDGTLLGNGTSQTETMNILEGDTITVASGKYSVFNDRYVNITLNGTKVRAYHASSREDNKYPSSSGKGIKFSTVGNLSGVNGDVTVTVNVD